MKSNKGVRFALATAAALVIAVIGIHLSADTAQAQFGDMLGNCVPWCDEDDPVHRATWEGTDVYVYNKSPETIWVLMSYFVEGDSSSSCLAVEGVSCASSDRWENAGFYEIEPWDQRRLLQYYDNQYIYFYAVGKYGREWSGDLYDDFNGNRYGFFQVDLGTRSDTYTLNIVD